LGRSRRAIHALSGTYEIEDDFPWTICRQFIARFVISTHEKPAFQAGFKGKVAERMGFEN
jgi:hypothetical protein